MLILLFGLYLKYNIKNNYLINHKTTINQGKITLNHNYQIYIDSINIKNYNTHNIFKLDNCIQ